MEKNYEIMQTVSDQIVHEIYSKVASGELKKGEKLPSINEMAIQWSVSPDTVETAYSQLEHISLVETKRGLGTFVSNNENWTRHFHTSLIFERLNSLIDEMEKLDVSVDAVIAYLKSSFLIRKDVGLFINNIEDVKKFLDEFENYSEIDEQGHYSITFRNEIDYLNEEVWTTLFKSDDKWYFYSHGESWMPLKAKEMTKIIPFVLKYSKSICEVVTKKMHT